MPTYTDPVIVNGSTDAEQLVVRGNTTQTKALQEWRKDATTLYGRVTNDGRLQVGSFSSGVMETDESLIEAHRLDTDTTKPKRGFHLKGGIAGTLNAIVNWVVHELTLKGSSISTLHNALRVQLRNEATGATGSAELRGGDIEVINAGASSTMPTMTGLRVAVGQEAGAAATAVYGLKVEMTNTPLSGYAVHTTGGKVHLGGLGSGLVRADSSGDLSSAAFSNSDIPNGTITVSKLANGTPNKVIGYDITGTPTMMDAPSTSGGAPTGAGMPYFGSVAPSGWLLCDGTAVSRTTYAALLAIIGDVYKAIGTLATRTSDTGGTIDLGYSTHGITAGSATLTLRFTLAAATISAVNTTTEVITMTAVHLLDTGDKVRVSSTATLPTGLVAGTDYYVRVVSTTTLTLHPTLTDAQANTNLINLTGAGTGTRTITPQDEAVRSAMTVGSVAGSVLTLSGGSGHSLPAAARSITVEGASGLFFLPDLRGRTAIGAGQGSGLSNRTLGKVLGEEMHQLTIAEMPSHRHTNSLMVYATSPGGSYSGGSVGNELQLSLQGGDQPHNIMQPSLVTNYIIKA